MIIEAVRCDHCNILCDSTKPEFYTVQGNVYIGLEGGLIGNNFKDDKCVKIQHFCNDCMKKILFDIHVPTPR